MYISTTEYTKCIQIHADNEMGTSEEEGKAALVQPVKQGTKAKLPWKLFPGSTDSIGLGMSSGSLWSNQALWSLWPLGNSCGSFFRPLRCWRVVGMGAVSVLEESRCLCVWRGWAVLCAWLCSMALRHFSLRMSWLLVLTDLFVTCVSQKFYFEYGKWRVAGTSEPSLPPPAKQAPSVKLSAVWWFWIILS